MGVEAFAVFENPSPGARVLAARGVRADGLDTHGLAHVTLGAGRCVLGYLVIYRTLPRRGSLDAFDRDLLDALGPPIAVALHSARASIRPTARPEAS
jgi:hypothetical protein